MKVGSLLWQKKLSIPSTITRVLKYIPELRSEVEKLDQKKKEQRTRVDKSTKRGNLETDHRVMKKRRTIKESPFGVVWVNTLGDEEVVIQLCTNNNKSKKSNIRVSNVLVTLEEKGLLLLNISSFESFGEKAFYNLHLQVFTYFPPNLIKVH